MLNKLFSYGTLRYEKVQLDTFGRKLDTQPSQLVGFKLDQVEITDPAVLASSGEKFHPIIYATRNPQDLVDGVILFVTDKELAQADGYEVDDYKRSLAKTTDGQDVWVYVANQSMLENS